MIRHLGTPASLFQMVLVATLLLFSAAHAAKDSGIALALAKEKKLDLPLAAATFKQYSKMAKIGLGELDKSGIAELTFKGRGGKGLRKK